MPKPQEGPPPLFAPALTKKGRSPPTGFEVRDSGGTTWTLSVLKSFGLNPVQCSYLWCDFADGLDRLNADGDRLPPFNAVPRNRNLPGQSATIHTAAIQDLHSSPDQPWCGMFHFEMRLWLGERSEAIELAFKKWLRIQKKLFGLSYQRPDKGRRDVLFLRNLVVFAMSRPPRWPIEDIEVQLKYMALPSLLKETTDPTSKHKFRKGNITSDPKAARREIIRRFSRLLQSVQKSPLF